MMSLKSFLRRFSLGPSSVAVYTQLPNDSTASIASSTEVDHPHDDEAVNGRKDDRTRVDASPLNGESEEEEERRQDGVKQAEAITSSWTLRALIFTYILYANIPRTRDHAKLTDCE